MWRFFAFGLCFLRLTANHEENTARTRRHEGAVNTAPAIVRCVSARVTCVLKNGLDVPVNEDVTQYAHPVAQGLVKQPDFAALLPGVEST